MIFEFGSMLVVIYPRWGGRLARYLLFRTASARGGRTLIASGSEESLSSCLSRARRAAQGAGALP